MFRNDLLGYFNTFELDLSTVCKQSDFEARSMSRHYMAEILPIQRKTLSNQSINQSKPVLELFTHGDS